MWSTPIGRLRIFGLAEGISFLVLLGIAMPLKYFADMPAAVKVVGWIHGLLFIGFCATLLVAKIAMSWSVLRAGGVFLAALLPFGTLVIDGRLKREDDAFRSS